jgi:hypothetical protein
LAVFVLDKREKPLMGCSEKRARLLLTRGRAVVHRGYPLTIRLKDRIGGEAGYHQGMLAGYELREYVFEKFGHHCGYCGAADAPLSLDDVVPRSRGGSNRVSHLVPPSIAGNQDSQEALSIEEFLAHDPKCLAAIQARLKVQDGALKATTGRGFYGRTKLDKHGFPRGHCVRTRSVHGFKAGDMVRAEVPTRKGAHVGRAAVRESGSFSIGKAQHINCAHCRMLQHADGYGFAASASPAASFGLTDFDYRLAPTLAIGRG